MVSYLQQTSTLVPKTCPPSSLQRAVITEPNDGRLWGEGMCYHKRFQGTVASTALTNLKQFVQKKKKTHSPAAGQTLGRNPARQHYDLPAMFEIIYDTHYINVL